jgi:hypothetical protein
MSDLVQKGVTNLPPNLCFARADGLDVLLVEENMIRGISRKDAFQSHWNSGEKSQQQTTAMGLQRGRIFNNNCEIGKPAAKWIGKTFQDLIGNLLETLALHRTIVHPAGLQLVPAEPNGGPVEVTRRGAPADYVKMADNAGGLTFQSYPVPLRHACARTGCIEPP